MGCCKNYSNPKTPEYIDSCCKIRGPRCICLPYDDAYVIAAMVLSMVAVLISWVWYVTLLISIVGMVIFQLFWCCRQPEAMIHLSVVAAVFSSLTQLGVGFWVLIEFRNKISCYPYSLHWYGDLDDPELGDYKIYQNCTEVKWACIAFVCGTLWAIIAGFIIHFILSGRHAKWEEARSNRYENTNSNATAIATTTTTTIATATAVPSHSTTPAIVVELGSAPEPSATGRGPSIATAMAMTVLPSATGANSTIDTATAVVASEIHKPEFTNS